MSPTSRRPYGSGSIRSRGRDSSGVEVLELRVYCGRDPLTGKSVVVSERFRGGRRAAADRLAAMIAERRDQALGRNATLSTLLDRWLDQTARRGRAAGTLELYRRWCDTRIRPALGDVRLGDLTTHRIDEFLNSLDDDLAPRTIGTVRAVLRAALEQAVRWAWIDRNPVAGTSERRVESRTGQIDGEAVRRLVERLAQIDATLGYLTAFAAITGARRGEICGLRWSDVSFGAETVRIERAVVPGAGGQRVTTTKTRTARTIPAPVAMPILRAQWHRTVETVGEPRPGWYVFGLGDQPIRAKAVTEAFARAARELGIRARFHDLRHFAVTRAVAAGWDVTTASRYFGHTPQTMLGTYSHGDADRARELAAGIEEV